MDVKRRTGETSARVASKASGEKRSDTTRVLPSQEGGKKSSLLLVTVPSGLEGGQSRTRGWCEEEMKRAILQREGDFQRNAAPGKAQAVPCTVPQTATQVRTEGKTIRYLLASHDAGRRIMSVGQSASPSRTSKKATWRVFTPWQRALGTAKAEKACSKKL